jgi:hypothetical protein
MNVHTVLERRLTKAGLLIAGGLTIEIVATAFVHPLAFVTFLVIACPLVLAGMLLFLWTLVSTGS